MKQLLSQWRSPAGLLLLMSMAMPLSFATWQTLLNNFVIEQANFDGAAIGLLQSLREVPGFLAFTAIFVLLVIREQPFALLSLAMLAIGVAATGFFPNQAGLYITTFVMSVGFHYFETIKSSLSLQWLSKDEAPLVMGRMVAAGSFSSLVVYGLIWSTNSFFDVDYKWMYLAGGGFSCLIVLFCALNFKQFAQPHIQHKHLVLRKKYWLYYALTFLSGARRQIFVVFAGFMMVEKFHYDISAIAALLLINHVFNFFFAAKIGRLIARIGERRALMLEYVGLILVFVSYALVEIAEVAALLYVLDHLLFAMAIAIKTYFQKIADPKDIASTAGVSFTINHIAAVVIPALFGLIWLTSPALVFYLGAIMAGLSLILALNVPSKPQGDRVANWGNVVSPAA